jgi:chorismate mutase
MHNPLKIGLLLACLHLAPATLAAAPATLAPLLSSIEQRLAIADQVALSKWDSRKPVEDSAREQQVIAAAMDQASLYKIEQNAAQQFFSDQIEANKLVQYAKLNAWTLAAKAPELPRPDLTGSIRPKLDALQKRLLQQFADFSAARHDKQCPRWLAQGIEAARVDDLHRLALIRATAQLCVR